MADKRQLILAEIPKLRRFARSLAGDPALADDLVQDCLERALSRLDQWQQGTNIRAWLYTILRNIHLNQLRYTSRRPAELPFDEAGENVMGTAPSQNQRLIVRDMGQALDKLPLEQREVILLVGLEDMSYKETSEILGVPVGTIMSRLSRGREALRRLMDGQTQDRPTTLRRVK